MATGTDTNLEKIVEFASKQLWLFDDLLRIFLERQVVAFAKIAVVFMVVGSIGGGGLRLFRVVHVGVKVVRG